MTAHKPITQEMVDDLHKMCDKDFCKKWGTSRQYPIRNRKKLGIKSFTPQHGTKRKIIDGVEHKWCPQDEGHWEPLSGFRKIAKRAGGYAGICMVHDRINKREYYRTKVGREKQRNWKKTENGKKCLRNTWRKQKAIKDNAYVKWDIQDEINAYEIFGHRCGYCGEEVEHLSLEFDHYIPISLGGKTEPKNMVPCCSACNHGIGGKFNREPEEWIRWRFSPEYASDIIKDVVRKLETLAVLGNG